MAAQRGRIAAVTAAALLSLFASQPLHGAAATAATSAAPVATSFAADPGVATPDAHHAHLCPLCRAANQARVAIIATPFTALAATAFHPFSIHAAPLGPALSTDLCASGPRAPPFSLSSLV
jgi:hypothetical protein